VISIVSVVIIIYVTLTILLNFFFNSDKRVSQRNGGQSRIIEKFFWSMQDLINNFDEAEKLLFRNTILNTIKNSKTAEIEKNEK